MARVGYVYNRTAANLRTANAGLIGLVINDLRNPFFTEFATSAQMALSERGYATVVANTDENPKIQAQVVGSMIEHGVSALVISPAFGQPDATFDSLQRASVPTMQVLRRADPRVDLFPFSSPAYPDGSRAVARHLLESGARRIAFVGGIKDRPVTNERMAGYLETMQRHGRAIFVVNGRPTRAFGFKAALEMSAGFPEIDAAICFNDLVALGMLSGFARTGRKVGTDFRLAGFDDIEECAQVWPRLTSVRCDIARFGVGIAGTVVDWLEQGKMPESESRTPVQLVIRESTSGIAS
jgi:LacI family transcriptional regulator